jgi:hypothetical protein
MGHTQSTGCLPKLTEKIGWVGDDSHLVFGKKFHGQKEGVRWCVVMQQPVLLLPKFGANFHAVTAVCRIDCLACQDEFLKSNPLDVK